MVLGQVAAGLFVGFTAIRFLLAAFYPKPILMWLFLGLSTLLLLTSYQSPLQLLAFLASNLVGFLRQRQAVQAG